MRACCCCRRACLTTGLGAFLARDSQGSGTAVPRRSGRERSCGPDCTGTPGGRRELGTGGVRHNKSLGARAVEHARAPTGLTWQVCQLWAPRPAPCCPPSDGIAGSALQGGQPPLRPGPSAKCSPAGQVRGRQLPAPSQACPQGYFLSSIPGYPLLSADLVAFKRFILFGPPLPPVADDTVALAEFLIESQSHRGVVGFLGGGTRLNLFAQKVSARTIEAEYTGI